VLTTCAGEAYVPLPVHGVHHIGENSAAFASSIIRTIALTVIEQTATSPPSHDRSLIEPPTVRRRRSGRRDSRLEMIWV